MTDRIPRVLKLDHWPQTDRDLWVALLAEGDFPEDDGAGCTWSEGTRGLRRQAYGQWLSHLARTDPAALALPPVERITQGRVKAFLVESEARLKPKSVANLMTSLFLLAKALDGARDWSWFSVAERRIAARSRSISLPPAKPISAGRIFRWSVTRLRELTEGRADLSPVAHAIEFRRALLVGFLIALPVRRRAVCAMEADLHLVPVHSGFLVTFRAEDMKDKKERSAPLARELVEPLRLYLREIRPVLARGRASPGLWITHHGKAFSADGLASDIEITTARHLGVKLHPHAFRHIAATSIAEVDPEHVGIIKDILGHATLDMAERHYNRASGISSCNALQSILEDIRTNVPRMGRAKPDRAPRRRDPRNR